MIPRLPGRLDRLLYAWASNTTPHAFCRRFALLNKLRWHFPIHVEALRTGEESGFVLKISDDAGCFAHIGRTSRLPLYVKGVTHRRRQIVNEYLLNELTFTENDLVVDVGANVGDLTAALQAQAGVHAICIEPEGVEYAALCRNVLAERTSTYKTLLFSHECDIPFYSANDSGDSSVFEPPHIAAHTTRRATTLDVLLQGDRIFRSLGRIKLLKLEAEGAEPEILMGAENTLSRCDYIAADCGPERGVQQETTVIPVLRTLTDHGFTLIRFGWPRCVMLFKRDSP